MSIIWQHAWSEIRFKISRFQRCTMSKKAVVTSHLSCRVHFSVMSDVHVLCYMMPLWTSQTSILLLLAAQGSICCVPLVAGAKSLATSSLEVQFQEYNNEMLQSFHIDSIHGTQNASFVSTSAQPAQSMSYTLTFFTWPNSGLTLQVKDH